MEDTIAILRGLQDRYEVHHGVEITDPAIIAAATLSHRYISGRQLPDKAIDLVDEAASRIRMEIDSMPEANGPAAPAADPAEDRARGPEEGQGRGVAAAPGGPGAGNRQPEREFSDLEEVWKSEKAAVQGTTHVKEALEQARLEMETARRAGDLSRMSELAYGRIPELEKQLKAADEAQHREMRLLRNKVTEEEIAEVVSKWTGIPVSKMLEGEKAKLLQMEQVIGQRVVGQTEGIRAVSEAIRRSRAGIG